MLTGEVSFAMGYTEPIAGADLTSLQTRAEEDSNEYLIRVRRCTVRRPSGPS